MEKFYYDVHDLEEITGYKQSKCSQIIKELNIELENYLKSKNRIAYIIAGRIPIWFFQEATGIERGNIYEKEN